MQNAKRPPYPESLLVLGPRPGKLMERAKEILPEGRQT